MSSPHRHQRAQAYTWQTLRIPEPDLEAQSASMDVKSEEQLWRYRNSCPIVLYAELDTPLS